MSGRHPRGFASDNNSGAHPEVLAAIAAANEGHVVAYGDDDYTAVAPASASASTSASRPRRSWSSTAPAPTSLAIDALTRPHEAVICTEVAHLNVDECGAPERIAGVKLLAVADRRRQAHARRWSAARITGVGDEHASQPRVVSISQSTELGTVYTPEEIARARRRRPRARDVPARRRRPPGQRRRGSLDLPLRALTTDAGVDVVSFGGTKNGLLLGDAVVFLRPELAEDFLFIRKQSMQLASKMRFLAVQFDALLAGDLWRRNASHANAMAARLADAISERRRRRARLPGGGQRRLRHPARRGDRAPARRAPGGAALLRLGRGRRDDPPHVLVGHDRGGRRRPGVGARGCGQAMSAENVEIVRRGYEHLAATGELLGENLRPRVRLGHVDLPRLAGAPDLRGNRGSEGVPHGLGRRLGGLGARGRGVPRRRRQGRRDRPPTRPGPKATGLPVDMHFAQVWTLRDGKQTPDGDVRGPPGGAGCRRPWAGRRARPGD